MRRLSKACSQGREISPQQFEFRLRIEGPRRFPRRHPDAQFSVGARHSGRVLHLSLTSKGAVGRVSSEGFPTIASPLAPGGKGKPRARRFFENMVFWEKL